VRVFFTRTEIDESVHVLLVKEHYPA